MDETAKARDLIQLSSLLSVLERDLKDFAETWDPDTVPQRLDDLMTLVSSIKALLPTA